MDALSFLLGYHKGKVQGSGGGLIETDVFSSHTVSGFTKDVDFPDAYFADSPVSFGLEVNETYYVEWDDVTYTCKGTSGSLGEITSVYIGNGKMLAHPGNDEPFAIVCVDDTTIQFIAFDDDKSEHTVRIYQKKSGVTVTPLNVTQNGEYTAPGVAYSPVNVDVAGGTVDFPFGLREIVSETEVKFNMGAAAPMFEDNPAAILDGNIDYFKTGESGLVIWDGDLYAVYSGLRKSAPTIGKVMLALGNAVGNLGIIKTIYGSGFIEEYKSAGSSEEPFFISGNTILIADESTEYTHTVQIFKFVEEQTNE